LNPIKRGSPVLVVIWMFAGIRSTSLDFSCPGGFDVDLGFFKGGKQLSG
jgi:hypothetical protein